MHRGLGTGFIPQYNLSNGLIIGTGGGNESSGSVKCGEFLE
jgi:hypothetical protein